MSSLVCTSGRLLNGIVKRRDAPEYSFRGDGRDGVVYAEGERRMRIDCELLTGKINRVIYVSSIHRWQPPHEGEPVTEQERALILQRLCRYYEECATTYELG